VVAPTPENLKGVLGTLWPMVRAASPVTVLLLLGLWFLSIRWFTVELGRVHTVNQALWERLLVSQREQIDLAWRCYEEDKRPRPE
jgi:hypothetical protein